MLTTDQLHLAYPNPQYSFPATDIITKMLLIRSASLKCQRPPRSIKPPRQRSFSLECPHSHGQTRKPPGASPLRHHLPHEPLEGPATSIELSEEAKSILPPEIQDMFIDQLSDDKEALRTCSLVCRSWLPRCNYYLWSSVDISLTRKNGAAVARRLEDFLATSPHICSRICELHFIGDVSPIPVTYLDESSISRIVRLVPGLQVVSLQSFQLVAKGVGEDSDAQALDLLAILSQQSNLRSLRLIDFTCEEWEDHAAPCSTSDDFDQHKPQLETLDLQNVKIPKARLAPLLDNLLGGERRHTMILRNTVPQCSCLRQFGFELEYNKTSNFDICGRVLKHAGPFIEHLKLDLFNVWGIPDELAENDLRHRECIEEHPQPMHG